jgi:hypothetical protein
LFKSAQRSSSFWDCCSIAGSKSFVCKDGLGGAVMLSPQAEGPQRIDETAAAQIYRLSNAPNCSNKTDQERIPLPVCSPELIVAAWD